MQVGYKREMLQELLEALQVLESFKEPPESISPQFLTWLLNVSSSLKAASMKEELELWEDACSRVKYYSDESSFETQMRSMKGIFLSIMSRGNLSSDVFPMEIVEEAKVARRNYIYDIARQVNDCYKAACFDACAVMIRKLIESLIIECFENKEMLSEITDSKSGNTFSLKDLITKFIEQDKKAWNLSRNLKDILPRLKGVGDWAAHSRHYQAKQDDIDKLQQEIRFSIQELVSIAFIRPVRK